MERITAFAPAHVTGLFFIQDTAHELLRRGSLGAGFSIELGVTTELRIFPRGSRIDTRARYLPIFFLDGEERSAEELPVSLSVYRQFDDRREVPPDFDLEIEHRIDPPQGSGFGTSGSGALSLALALNIALETGLSAQEAAGIAHIAEVENQTGLGTVIGEYFGGFELRTEAGAPGYGKIEPLAFEAGLQALFVSFGSYSTKEALSDPRTRERINGFGRAYHEELLASPKAEDFLRLSAAFSRETGLLSKRCASAIRNLEGLGHTAAMLMFGEGVFTLLPSDRLAEAEEELRRRFPEARVFSSPINNSGGRVI